MPKAPRVTAREVIRVIERIGFIQVRASGSHLIFRNEAGRRTTVPFHATEILHPKTLASILRDVGLTIEEFQKKLNEV